MKLDETDIRILDILQGNGRIKNAELAAAIGISPSPMLERVKKLERNGVIQKYVALVDAARIGKAVTALVSVSLAVHQLETLENFEKKVTQFSEVVECFHITGESDFFLKVVVSGMDAYREFVLHKLTQIKGINRIRSSFVLDKVKVTTKIEVS